MSASTISAPPRPDRKTWLSRGRFPGFIDASNAFHHLKLRHNWKASDQLRIEFGLDYCINTNASKPWAGISMLLDGSDPEGWAAVVNSDLAVVCTPKLDLIPFTDRISLPVSARVGRDWFTDRVHGAPHMDLSIHNPFVAAVLAVVALAAKKPIHLERKEVGGLCLSVPITFKDGRQVPHSLQSRAEVDASLQAHGRGLTLNLHQLNAVLRLKQD